MSKKNHQRQLAAARARRQRRAKEVVNSSFIDSPWATWRFVRSLVDAGEIETECLTLLEHLPYRVNNTWITLAKTAELRSLTIERGVEALEKLERGGYLMWDSESNSVAMVATAEELADMRVDAELQDLIDQAQREGGA